MFRNYKEWFLVFFTIMTTMAAVSCVPDNEEIYGNYRWENTIYSNPASSFIMTKENADQYSITEDFITILHADGTKEQVNSNFKKSEVDTEAFNNLFIVKVGIPDISGIKKRLQYNVNEKYRLYVLDNEIWFAQRPTGTMWCIYRLVKI